MGATTVTMEAEGRSFGETLDSVGLLQEIAARNTCDECGSTSIKFSVRKVAPNTETGKKGGTFHELRCAICGASILIHQRKPENGGGFYLKWNEKFVKFVKRDNAPTDVIQVPDTNEE